jgi:hypothetical protein
MLKHLICNKLSIRGTKCLQYMLVFLLLKQHWPAVNRSGWINNNNRKLVLTIMSNEAHRQLPCDKTICVICQIYLKVFQHEDILATKACASVSFFASVMQQPLIHAQNNI